ncbi:hypothetical protein [Thalassococcus lentus]|uniref:Uncharacterized protein n=1 Tax=Thalassococcus lentus TaxID=1210524 RepID=A0ABT4XUS7_9RHOB|nr:hypothetical protein [Thalassococcus lentus]MDA7425600.1 hypothetical protein [Thalassococcus lentus]
MLASGSIIALKGGFEAKVTLILSNAHGELFGLTSRDFLQSAKEGVFVAGKKSSRQVGTQAARWHSNHEVWQGARAMGWFAIEKQAEVLSESYSVCEVANTNSVFAQNVWFRASDDSIRTGYVRRINTSLDIEYSDQTSLRVKSRLVEVQATSDAGFGEAGDAGSLIYTDSNKLLGLLIGFRDGRTLIAPLQDLFAAEEFKVASLEEIASHNKTAKEKPFEELIVEKIRDSRRPWWKIVRGLAKQSNSEFSRLRRIGLDEMETCQNKIAVAIFQIVGAPTYVDGLIKLHFENDAPGRHANENWLWRATFERMHLLYIAENRECFIVPGTTEEICPVPNIGDLPVVSPVAQYEEDGPLTPEAFAEMSLADQASRLLGENKIPTARAARWIKE